MKCIILGCVELVKHETALSSAEDAGTGWNMEHGTEWNRMEQDGTGWNRTEQDGTGTPGASSGPVSQ